MGKRGDLGIVYNNLNLTPPATTEDANKAQLMVWINSQAHLQLKLMSAKEKKPMQALVSEALNMLFSTRGEPPIA